MPLNNFTICFPSICFRTYAVCLQFCYSFWLCFNFIMLFPTPACICWMFCTYAIEDYILNLEPKNFKNSMICNPNYINFFSVYDFFPKILLKFIFLCFQVSFVSCFFVNFCFRYFSVCSSAGVPNLLALPSPLISIPSPHWYKCTQVTTT